MIPSKVHNNEPSILAIDILSYAYAYLCILHTHYRYYIIHSYVYSLQSVRTGTPAGMHTHVLTHDSMKAVFDVPPTFYKNLWKRVTSKCHENQIQLLVQTEGQQ